MTHIRTQVSYEDESGVALLTKHEVLVPRVGDRIAVTPASGETVHGKVESVHWTTRREYTVATVVVERDASDYVPAVRRVVAWVTEDQWGNKAKCLDRDDAYLQAGRTMVFVAWRDHPTWPAGLNEHGWLAFEAHWPAERVQRLADWLLRRDEKAGY